MAFSKEIASIWNDDGNAKNWVIPYDYEDEKPIEGELATCLTRLAHRCVDHLNKEWQEGSRASEAHQSNELHEYRYTGEQREMSVASSPWHAGSSPISQSQSSFAADFTRPFSTPKPGKRLFASSRNMAPRPPTEEMQWMLPVLPLPDKTEKQEFDPVIRRPSLMSAARSGIALTSADDDIKVAYDEKQREILLASSPWHAGSSPISQSSFAVDFTCPLSAPTSDNRHFTSSTNIAPLPPTEEMQCMLPLPDKETTSQQQDARSRYLVCTFCKTNDPRAHVYTGHTVKDPTGRVTCPILRKYTCQRCGATGDNAHTVRYCPLRSGEDDVGLPDVRKLKATLRNACGARRRLQ